MNGRRFGVGLLVLLAGAYFFLFVQDPLPARTDVAIDWSRVRALAGEPSSGPRSIGSEVVARGRFFGWMICAGCGWGEVPMEFRTYQLRFADGESVVIDAVHGADLHASMPMMKDHDAAAFERQTQALRRADAIVLTHEHWDHASGLRAILDDPLVRARVQLPAAQRDSAAIREAGFSDADLAGLPAIPDADYRAIAPGVVAIAMPGHTPGSQVVYVRRADGAEYLFLGDIVWNARNLRERRGKSRLISAVAGEDAGRLLPQIAYFADLAAGGADSPAGAPDLHFVVAHDPEQNRALLEAGWIEEGLDLRDAPYAVVPNWPALAPDVALGETSGVGVDSHGHVFVFHRGPGPSILALDPADGHVVGRFGDGLFSNPHGLAIGPNDEVWVTDTGHHQVLRFSHEGELLGALGERGVAGDDLQHFDQPTDLAFSSSGEIFVSDGYGNSRVVRFSPGGDPIASFGKKGSGPGEFDLPHGITIDAQDRLYVADRTNRRVQVLDSAGRHLASWGTEVFGEESRPWGVEVRGEKLFVIDGGHMDPARAGFAQISRLDLAGRVEARFSRYGSQAGELAWGHDVAVGPDGAIYTAEVRINDRAQKFLLQAD